ncbi:hypothetical protein Droror1_Dr00014456 [Drosera rotundifolia]
MEYRSPSTSSISESSSSALVAATTGFRPLKRFDEEWGGVGSAFWWRMGRGGLSLLVKNGAGRWFEAQIFLRRSVENFDGNGVSGGVSGPSPHGRVPNRILGRLFYKYPFNTF